MATIKDVRQAGTLLSNEFIQILDEAFPDKMPMPGTPPEQIQQDIGKIQVIRQIKMWKAMLDNPDEYPEDTSIF
jgi:hypothetical protein